MFVFPISLQTATTLFSPFKTFPSCFILQGFCKLSFSLVQSKSFTEPTWFFAKFCLVLVLFTLISHFEAERSDGFSPTVPFIASTSSVSATGLVV
ncbi:unnamed protein product [Citrullus colocynthis]|uniref:Uncharacterized protein n=1 Tax=Citrullus colocynthis TaxID=252529 RepID=A0ABP0YGP1_9ROSI